MHAKTVLWRTDGLFNLITKILELEFQYLQSFKRMIATRSDINGEFNAESLLFESDYSEICLHLRYLDSALKLLRNMSEGSLTIPERFSTLCCDEKHVEYFLKLLISGSFDGEDIETCFEKSSKSGGSLMRSLRLANNKIKLTVLLIIAEFCDFVELLPQEYRSIKYSFDKTLIRWKNIYDTSGLLACAINFLISVVVPPLQPLTTDRQKERPHSSFKNVKGGSKESEIKMRSLVHSFQIARFISYFSNIRVAEFSDPEKILSLSYSPEFKFLLCNDRYLRFLDQDLTSKVVNSRESMILSGRLRDLLMTLSLKLL
ncbi:MAG: hypothetical protein SGCHY_002669 [Lobulomycetales sp.]